MGRRTGKRVVENRILTFHCYINKPRRGGGVEIR